jgi:hypothetical protein
VTLLTQEVIPAAFLLWQPAWLERGWENDARPIK